MSDRFEEKHPVVLYLDKLKCHKESYGESGDDDVFIKVFKDDSTSCDKYFDHSRLHLGTGDSAPVDIAINCQYLTKVRVEIIDYDSTSDNDSLGIFTFTRDLKMDKNGEGSMTVNQTTGHAQAKYEMFYRVIRKPIPTVRVFGFYCHNSTTGIDETVAGVLATGAEKVLEKTAKVMGKSPRPRKKARAKGFQKAAEIIGEYGQDIIMWFCNKREGDDEVYLQHVLGPNAGSDGALYPKDGKFVAMHEEVNQVEYFKETFDMKSLFQKPGPAQVYFDEPPHSLPNGEEYIRIAMDADMQENIILQLKERDYIKRDVTIGHIEITPEHYQEYKDMPLVDYLDDYFSSDVPAGQGAMYSICYSMGIEDWSKPATAAAQGAEDKVHHQLDLAQYALNISKLNSRAVVPVLTSTGKAQNPQDLSLGGHTQNGGAPYWNKFWYDWDEIEAMMRKAEEMYEDYVDGISTLYVTVDNVEDESRSGVIHRDIETAYNHLQTAYPTADRKGQKFQMLIVVTDGVADYGASKALTYNGHKQSEGPPNWNSNWPDWAVNSGTDGMVDYLKKEAELAAFGFVLVDYDYLFDRIDDAQLALSKSVKNKRAIIPILKTTGEAQDPHPLTFDGHSQGDGSPWNKKWRDWDQIKQLQSHAEGMYQNCKDDSPVYVVVDNSSTAEGKRGVVHGDLTSAYNYLQTAYPTAVRTNKKYQMVIMVKNYVADYAASKNLEFNGHRQSDGPPHWNSNWPDYAVNYGIDSQIEDLKNEAEIASKRFYVTVDNIEGECRSSILHKDIASAYEHLNRKYPSADRKSKKYQMLIVVNESGVADYQASKDVVYDGHKQLEGPPYWNSNWPDWSVNYGTDEQVDYLKKEAEMMAFSYCLSAK